MAEDPFIWMENLEDMRVREFIDSENRRFKNYIGDFPSRIYDDVKKFFFKTAVLGAQLLEDGFLVLKRFKDRFVLERYFWKSGDVVKILDSKEIGKDIMLVGFKAFEDGNVLAYWSSKAGSDIMDVKIVDLDSLEVLDELKGSIFNIVFLDRDRFYYEKFFRSEKTPDGVDPPAERIFLREGGEDHLVFGEGFGTNYFIGLSDSLDRSRALLTISFGWARSKIFGGKLGDPSSWRLIFDAGESNAKPIDFIDGHYYIINYGEKGTGELLKVGEDGEYETILPEGKYPLESGLSIGDKILLSYLIDAVHRVDLFDIKSGEVKTVFDREYYSYIFLHSKFGEAILSRTTFWKPFELIVFRNGVAEIVLSESVDGDYVVEEGFVRSRDGTKIHYFEVRKRGGSGDIAYVYGYGGFNISLTPQYLFDLMKLLEDGHVFVMCNLRGGGEYGERWHKAGMLHNKINVFEDYIAVLEEFKRRGYKVVASGRSNGGLLVGATLTMRPDLMDLALIGYPVLDMLRFHKLFIGKAWVPEYGNPDDPRDREYLLKYSPYHKIREDVKYPPILVYTGLHDDRVHPAHALKFVAKMKSVGAPIFLRVETKSGHIGATPEIRLVERVEILSFLYKTLGVLSGK